MARTFTLSNPTAPASSKQTYAIFCLRRGLKLPTGDTRNEGFTAETACKEIKRLIALKETAIAEKAKIAELYRELTA